MEQNRRLIDADAAFRFFKEQKVKETGAYSKGMNNGMNIAMRSVHNPEAIPSVDAVEVVRCKDCKYWGCVSFWSVCQLWSAPLMGTLNYTMDDDFCSHGERRAEDG